ncbi:MAG: DUF3667 domain-containing protein [Gammaproteobacteria bacterium]|nr:DUF3667 domain-containing protein [Gammaproteobacteria bacterium]
MAKTRSPLPDHPNCLNCGTELSGQYCGTCGQRARGRLISLWELLQDAFGDLFEVDSRLWRTLIPLLIRPGKLTLDYLEGRRARYMPPFRMYLVLSVIFFVVAFFDPEDDLSLLFEPPPQPSPEEVVAQQEETAAKQEATETAVNEVLTELRDEGLIDAEDVDEANQVGDVVFGITAEDPDDGDGLNFNVNPATGECTFSGTDDMPDWLQRRLTRDRLETICERIGADDGKTLGNLVLDNIPIALIVLMPIMALVLKGLYPLSRRYFVEHLLFFVHFHSFFFLILTLQVLFARFAELVHLPEPLKILTIVAAAFYVPVYLYKAMRRVYSQGHFITFLKYVILSGTYTAGAGMTMLGALLFALISV